METCVNIVLNVNMYPAKHFPKSVELQPPHPAYACTILIPKIESKYTFAVRNASLLYLMLRHRTEKAEHLKATKNSSLTYSDLALCRVSKRH